MPKNPCHSMPKKMRSWCLLVEPWGQNPNRELQNMNRVLQIWTMISNSQLWTPILNAELQFWMLSSTGATPKFTKTSKLHRTVQNESRQCPNRLFFIIIYYYILYVFYFYYILFYIICILFLLYVILYYMYCHNSIFLLGIVFLT